MKCSKVRAFLVSSPYIGYETGNLIYLRRSTCAENTRYASTLELYQVGSLTNYFAVHIIIDNYDKTDSYHLSIILFHDFSINMFNSIYFHFYLLFVISDTCDIYFIFQNRLLLFVQMQCSTGIAGEVSSSIRLNQVS